MVHTEKTNKLFKKKERDKKRRNFAFIVKSGIVRKILECRQKFRLSARFTRNHCLGSNANKSEDFSGDRDGGRKWSANELRMIPAVQFPTPVVHGRHHCW